MPVTPWESCSGTLFQLRNLYPRSTQNTDVVSSINLPNPSISYLISGYLDYQDYLLYMLFRLLGQLGDSHSNNVNMCNQDTDIIGYIMSVNMIPV